MTRRCSLCHSSSHTRVRCPRLSENAPLDEHKKNQTPQKSGVVRVSHFAATSPHVVNLKEEKKQLEDIFVYREHVPHSNRKTVDWADMVREGNRSSSEAQRKIEEERSTKHSQNGNSYKKREPFQWKVILVRVAAVAVLVTLPFPALSYYKDIKKTSADVVVDSTNAFLSLQSSTLAALHANLPQAQTDLSQALSAFAEAQTTLDKEHRILQYIASLLPVVGTELTSRQNILKAGHSIALGNTSLIQGLEKVNKSTEPLLDRSEILREHLASGVRQYEQALSYLSDVDPKAVPAEYQKTFQDFRLLFATFINDMKDVVDLTQGLQVVFGGDDFKRYLVVFQNNREIRPTGGFMGSYAIVDVQKGKILNIEVPGGGTYDLQGQLDQYVKPPLPLQIVNGRFEFQDSNWWPDFPTSAEKMAWFYEHSRKTTVDGVIAVNATVLERLLRVMGPIQNKDYGVLLTAENALDTLQYEVEVDYDKEKNTPKAILSEVLKQFMENVGQVKPEQSFALLTELQQAMEQKEIQMYFTDKKTQRTFHDFGWTGEIIKTSADQDYLFVANANLLGQKSDAKVKQAIEHQAVMQEDGSLIDTVIIRRTHTGVAGEMFTGHPNVSYVRVYVPQGAEILDAGGFTYPPEDIFHTSEKWYDEDRDVKKWEKEISVDTKTGTRVSESFGKTVFGNWIITNPGETAEAFIQYRLPSTVAAGAAETHEDAWKKLLSFARPVQSSAYSLIVQKQSGVESTFTNRIIYPEAWTPVWKSDDKINLALNGASFESDLKKDIVVGIVLEKAP